jgi:hypothetical protein
LLPAHGRRCNHIDYSFFFFVIFLSLFAIPSLAVMLAGAVASEPDLAAAPPLVPLGASGLGKRRAGESHSRGGDGYQNLSYSSLLCFRRWLTHCATPGSVASQHTKICSVGNALADKSVFR